MKIKEWKPYYIVDFVRCGTKTTVEIEDCTAQEMRDHCHKLFRQYSQKDTENAIGTKVRVRMVKRDGVIHVYGALLYRKSPIQFRKMLENTLSE